MKNLFPSLLVVLGLLPAALRAQTVPPMPPAPPANLQGVALRDWYRANWYDGKRVVLSYNAARGRMYNYVDNVNNQVTCVYSGYTENVPYNATSTNPDVVTDINCEHSIPQSWFDEVVRMRSDIHHLFPTRIQWNSDRGSDPFADVPDASTLGWLRGTTRLTTIPTSNIDEYSEDTNSQFEPREDHKGNLARAAFYFYTMHANEGFDPGKGVITALADLATLYRWHLADPVDAREIERNNRVAASQGNFNPYIAYPATVATAWNLAPAGPTFSFAAPSGTRAEGNTGPSTYTFTVNLSPAATAPVTVQVSVDAANSTATSGTDFVFASPTTVTFPAGATSQTVTLTVNGDTQPEGDETVVLTLANPSTGNSVGSPSVHTLTLTNDDGPAPTLAFAAATGSASEGNTGTSTYTTNVTLTNPGTLTFPITVPVTVDATGTTATPATDYTLSTPTLTFASAAALTQPVAVTVVGDLTYEPNETVRLLLGTPSDASITRGVPNAHVLTIMNDDTPPVGAPCTKLYFSQYIESNTGNTKVLEIYNPTASPMPLTGKRVVLYQPGNSSPGFSQPLTGTIAPGDVYVIGNTGLTSSVVAPEVDLLSNVCYFSGAHSLALFDGTDTLDVIGLIGRTPSGGGWSVTSGSTMNNSLVRQPTTSQGGRWNGPYGSATWSALGADNFAGVGSYSSSVCPLLTANRAATGLRNALEMYPNPTSGTVQLRLPGLPTARTAAVAVLDLLGRPVRQRTTQLSATAATQLDLSGLPAGIYAVRVSCADVEYSGRVVIQ
ncbi:endonuclease [Hymenobacter sp. BT664]|uniref:Endonuclease n=1 Tax=Hymenobacter montanus TaxID=2771359 RepID=A0A927GLA0_9BACT|nr:endonuclease [Hymenobacter montanus]MBD2769974.1 endonuclease [Hymenobacter montanus]